MHPLLSNRNNLSRSLDYNQLARPLSYDTSSCTGTALGYHPIPPPTAQGCGFYFDEDKNLKLPLSSKPESSPWTLEYFELSHRDNISLNTPLHELLLASLTCIGIGCTSGSLRCWTLRNKDILRPLVVDTRPWSPQDETSLDYIEDPCLLSLTALNLKGAFIEWNSVAYHGLLDLRTEHLSGTMCPTKAQLAMVLEASPRLRILRLADITIRDGEPHPTLVRLEDLQELDLRKVSTADLCALLDIIRPGRKELNVSMRLDDRPPTIQVVTAFFQRSNITGLFINGHSCGYHLPHLLRISSNLHQLGLESYDITESEFPHLIDASSQANAPPLWPNLRSFNLIGCRLDASILYEIAASYQLCKIRMWRCYLDLNLHGNNLWGMDSLVFALEDIVSSAQHFGVGTWQERKLELGWSFE
ncbi:hypothetical protein FRC09_013411 [Ceratobasidium sp. 395]|nr:hypothetical protein FRC09_013411 [Ceratobasidium sp. 395]